jgi:oxygen-independent coproporphyrinogen-3 oxidase
METLGIYISVPFCRAKCSYCNFASGVFSRDRMARYVDRLCEDLRGARAHAAEISAQLPAIVDTIYFGGGTPSLLPVELLERCLSTVRAEFTVAAGAEITMECAPGQMPDPLLANFGAWGVNRVSLGVQSFVDAEAKAVGRLHTRSQILDDIARLRHQGIENINVDLIAGLPQQTEASWQESLDVLLETAVPHASVYMLEVDEDSRLGLEVIAGGVRYHAHEVPPEDQSADFYISACERLELQGIRQYEISNFARTGRESRHNNKYWVRDPYLGFGLDAHSMLHTHSGEAVRLATTDSMENFLAGTSASDVTPVSRAEALEEEWFLGLRMLRGVAIDDLIECYGAAALAPHRAIVEGAIAQGLVERVDRRVRLTQRGRLLSNEVFERFIGVGEKVPA